MLAGAAAVAVAVAAAGVVLGAGVPEEVECLTGPVRALTTASASPATSSGPAGCPTEATGTGSGRGLTARALSATDGVSAPSTRPSTAIATALDLLGRAFPGERCAPGLTGASEPTILCATGGPDDPGGATLLQRCAAGQGPGSLVCADTADDPRTTLDTSAAADQTAWCQDLREPTDTSGPTMTVRWACASYAGDVFFCSNRVSTELVRGFTRDGIRYEQSFWETDRKNWPPTCDSRTLGDPALADCTTPDTTGTTTCTVPPTARGGTARTITCTQLPGTAEEARTSPIIGKPLHCTTRRGRASGVPAPPPRPVTAAPPAPLPAVDCSATAGRDELRRHLTADSTTFRALVCAAPADVSGGDPTFYQLDARPDLSTARGQRVAAGPLPASARAGAVARRHASFVRELSARLPGLAPVLPGLAIGPPGGSTDFFPGLGGGGVIYLPGDVLPGQVSAYEDLARDVLGRAGVLDVLSAQPGLAHGLAIALAGSAAGTTTAVDPSLLTRPVEGTSAEASELWVVWVHSQLAGHADDATVAAVLVVAAQASSGTVTGFAAALLPAAQQVPTDPDEEAALVSALGNVAAHPSWPGPAPFVAGAVVQHPDGSCQPALVCPQP